MPLEVLRPAGRASDALLSAVTSLGASMSMDRCHITVEGPAASSYRPKSSRGVDPSTAGQGHCLHVPTMQKWHNEGTKVRA
jgi:hypothetical protein